MQETYKALVVDDTSASAEMLAASLRNGGYEVLTCSDGLVALGLVAEQSPDVVLLDLKLPGRDGIEVCRTLKEDEETAPIPIIFITAVSEADVMLQAFDAGAADYITKPFRTAEVLARVSVHAKLRRAEAALQEKKQWTEERAKELTEANVHLASLSRSDPLTNLLNRRAWEEASTKEHERFDRHGTMYSLLVIDVDQFKNFNDSLGHQAGDDCLRQVAGAIQSTCRQIDIVGRYGGEEFVVLMPETGVEDGFRLAERIRKAIWALGIEHPASSIAERITASTGVASAAPGSWDDVLKRADDALYVAKKAGRNMVYADHRSRRMAHDEKDEAGTDLLALDGIDELGAANADPMSGATFHPPVPVRSSPMVMIVDDNEQDRSVLRRYLEREDFVVKEACNGKEALTIVTDRTAGDESVPDVIVMDVGMPELDGLECTRRLRSDPDTRDIPVLIVSAHDDGAKIVEGLSVGADEYLPKPIRADEFVLRVRSMARLHRERSHLMHSYAFRGEKTRILGSVLDFARTVGSSNQLKHVIKHTLEVTAEVTSSSRVSVMLPGASKEYLKIAQSIGMDEDVARRIRVPVGQMISGDVFANQKAVVINHQWEARFQRQPEDAPFFEEVPLVSAPLGFGSEVVGVLNVTDRFGQRPFDTQHLEAIDLIASIAGAAIHGIISRNSQEQACDSTLHALARLAENRSLDVGLHLERVARYCSVLSESLRVAGDFSDEVNEAYVRHIQRAVPLHDIGKLGLPDRILLKPGKLTAEERKIMQSHATIGAEAIRSATVFSAAVDILEMAAVIAQSHHERFDGTGYPEGLQGSAIPVAARIMAVADAYDALTTKRVYREANSPERAIHVLKEQAGTHFDPVIIDALIRCQVEFQNVATELSEGPTKKTAPPKTEAIAQQ